MDEKFSYSKLSTYESCGWKFKIQYVDKHFISSSTIANEFGTLIHYIEETIANDIINNNNSTFGLDYQKYINLFINIEEENVLGVKKLKEKYPKEFLEKDKIGLTYEDKANIYLNDGIYRLSEYLNTNKNLVIFAAEKEFNLNYNNYIFHGFIDRIFKDIYTNEIYIEDIKTWNDISGHDLVTPLQFVFYVLACSEIFNIPVENIHCAYDLPLVNIKQLAGTKGFIKRGTKKIDKLLNEISLNNFIPNPSPLCHWCVFSKTFPNQPEEAKNLCPYYSNWTKTNKNFSCDYEWMGIENHEKILEDFIKRNSEKESNIKIISKPKINIIETNERMFFVRRK